MFWNYDSLVLILLSDWLASLVFLESVEASRLLKILESSIYKGDQWRQGQLSTAGRR